MKYNSLVEEIEYEKIELVEMEFSNRIRALYCEKVIAINKKVKTTAEKTCILAEELGHHYTSFGDILDQSILANKKQELKARRWAVRKLIKIDDLVKAFEAGVCNRKELADFLEVTEEFIITSIEHFKGIYGLSHAIGEHIICFDPLYIVKKLE